MRFRSVKSTWELYLHYLSQRSGTKAVYRLPNTLLCNIFYLRKLVQRWDASAGNWVKELPAKASSRLELGKVEAEIGMQKTKVLNT